MLQRSALAAVLDGAREASAAQAAATPIGQAALDALWSAIGRFKRAALDDIDDRIGRLPSVLTIAPPGPCSAWLIAQHVAGDDPARVQATFDDIVSRNRVSHPGMVNRAAVEVLP